MQDAIMEFGQRKMDEERLRKLLMDARGGGAGMGNTLSPGLYGSAGGGGFTSVRGGTGPTQIPTGG